MRAALRLIRRNVRRAIRTNLLVVALIALSVGLGVYSAVTVRSQAGTSIDTYRSEVGNSEFRVNVNNPKDPDGLVDALEQRGISVLRTDDVSVPAVLPEIEATYASAVDVDLEKLLQLEVILDLEGRKPEVAGEIAVSRRFAATNDLEIGDATTTVSGKEITIVGLVQVRPTYFEETIYLPVGSLDEQRDALVEDDSFMSRTTTLGLSGVSRDELSDVLTDVVGGAELTDFESGFDEQDRSFWILSEEMAIAENFDFDPAQAVAAIVSSVMLFQTGLISAVAFIVSLRRRTFDIGRLSALGAEPAQLRRMLTVEAALLGAVGAIVGIVGGLSAVYLQANVVEPWMVGDPKVRPFVVNWAFSDLFWPGVLAVVAAMLAMWFPARWAANLSPEQARNGGYKQRKIPSWFVPASAAVLVVGLFMLLVSADLVSNATDLPVVQSGRDVLIPISGIPIILGAAGLVYAAMGFLYNGSFRLPLPFRLSARDALRNPIRSVGAVAAYMVLLTFIVAASSIDYAPVDAGGDAVENLGRALTGESSSVALLHNQAYIRSGGQEPFQGWVDLAEPTERVEWVGRLDDVDFDNTVEVQSLPEIGFSLALAPANQPLDYETFYSSETMFLGHPELLQELGVSQQTQEAMVSGSTWVLVSPIVDDRQSYDVRVNNFLEGPNGANDQAVTINVESLDPLNGIPILLVPPVVAETNGWSTIDSTLIYNQTGFSNDELRSFQRSGYTTPGWYGGQPPISDALISLLVVSIFILIISRILSALVSVDTSDELSSVMAVGAPARFRRTQLAWQAGYGVALAVLTAIPLGLIVGMTYAAGSVQEVFTYGPSWIIVGGLLMLPLVSASFIFLTTRSAQPNVSHRLV